MVKRKVDKKRTKTKTKQPAETFDWRALTVTLGLVVAVLALMVVRLSGQQINYQESQKLQAFEGVVSELIYNEFAIEGEQAASVDGFGVTDDKDLYADFTITKYEDHVPVLRRKARLHFQCDQKTDQKDGCAHAYWYGDWEETTAEYRVKYRKYLDEMEASVAAYNNAKTDEEREEILEQQKQDWDNYKDLFE